MEDRRVVFAEATNTWISKAEQITGRLVVRRIPELNPKATD